jgi:hypothetical protein
MGGPFFAFFANGGIADSLIAWGFDLNCFARNGHGKRRREYPPLAKNAKDGPPPVCPYTPPAFRFGFGGPQMLGLKKDSHQVFCAVRSYSLIPNWLSRLEEIRGT